jgi:hypothetical protein
MMQQNQGAMMAIQANIQEHQAMLYKQQIENVLGQPLPDMTQGPLPPDVMNQIATAAAQATQVVTGQAQALARAQELEQVDPIVKLKEAEIQQRAESDMLRAQVDAQRIQSQEAIAEMKIAQQREAAEMKEEGNVRKEFYDILKDVRSSDTNTKGE